MTLFLLPENWIHIIREQWRWDMTEFINVPRMWPTCLQLVKRQIHRLIIFLSRTVRHNTHGLFPKTFCLMFNRLMELQKQHPYNPARQEGTWRYSRLETICNLSWEGLEFYFAFSPFKLKISFGFKRDCGLKLRWKWLANHFDLGFT